MTPETKARKAHDKMLRDFIDSASRLLVSCEKNVDTLKIEQLQHTGSVFVTLASAIQHAWPPCQARIDADAPMIVTPENGGLIVSG